MKSAPYHDPIDVLVLKKISLNTLSIALVLFIFATRVYGDSSPEPGHYCTPLSVNEQILEQLTITLDQVAKAQQAIKNKGGGAATDIALGRAANALMLASTHGGAARTRRLIGAALTAKGSEDYQQLLGWFPLLNTALLTLPDDPEVRSAGTELGLAEDILQGDSKGNALKHLHMAAHYLGCDELDIPLEQANNALTSLFVKIAQGHTAKPSAFDKVLTLLRTAMNAMFERYKAIPN